MSLQTALAALCALAAGCATRPAPAPIEQATPDPSARARTYVEGDPSGKLDRMRRNAPTVGCRITERTSGTLFQCGDVQLWIVPDAGGMEVTCTGVHVNCTKRAADLLRE